MIELTDSTVITEEMISLTERKGAPRLAIKWLRRRKRTWGKAKKYQYYWAVWCMMFIPEWPIDLNGLSSYDKSRIMVIRHDCEIELDALDSKDKARVMAGRRDCKVDFSLLSCEEDKALVIKKRKRKGWPV